MRALDQLTRERSPERRGPLRYGRVFFDLRRHFGLTVQECLLLDVVDTLSRRTGWCYASRGYLAGLLGISRRSLQRLLAALREKGLLEARDTLGRQLRPTERWHRVRPGR